VFDWLRRELKRDVPKIGANLLYELTFLDAADIDVAGPFYDVQVAEPLLDENRLSYSLENLAQSYLGIGKREDEMRQWFAFVKESRIKQNLYKAPPAIVGPYAEGDVDLPLRIFDLQARLLEQQGLWGVFELESRLIPLLLAMWKRGVRVDLAKASQTYDLLAARQDETMAEIKHLSGYAPDIWAAASIAKVFDAAGVSYKRTAKTAKPSFTKEWLAACEHPVGKLIVAARRYDKFKGTFIRNFILDGHVDGRIHTSFHPLRSDDGGTVSGRLSSSNPNLQQIPSRDRELGPLIRSIFIPEADQRWWKCDWSQIEFRLAIHHAARMKLEGADAVVRQYHDDASTDYHTVVAQITGLPRGYAKNINFGILYGLGKKNLGAYLRGFGSDVADDIARQMYADYLQRLPFVQKLRQKAVERADEDGRIVTLSGRTRHFDAVKTKDGKFIPRQAFTRKALNARIQGDAADIMKIAMVQAWEAGLFADDLLGAPHLTVHDELDGSYTYGRREALGELIHIMETCVNLLVPLKVDSGCGSNWGDIK
jgi:DNA polymerase I-like protein with 3'-5' exonuclease and polymerase domains